MTAKTVALKHPVIDGIVHEVPAGKATEWREAGWKPATKAEVEEAATTD